MTAMNNTPEEEIEAMWPILRNHQELIVELQSRIEELEDKMFYAMQNVELPD